MSKHTPVDTTNDTDTKPVMSEIQYKYLHWISHRTLKAFFCVGLLGGAILIVLQLHMFGDDNLLELTVENGTSRDVWNMWQESLPCLESWVSATVPPRWSEIFWVCNDEWAYIDVVNAVGTTVEQQCHSNKMVKEVWISVHSNVYQTHKLFTFVRDPIKHFISGYNECAARGSFVFKAANESLLTRIEVADYPSTAAYATNWCPHHLAPQIESLLYHGDKHSKPLRFLDSIKYIGDKSDLKNFFLAHKLPWNDSKIDGRTSPIKDKLGRALRIESLSPTMVLSICDYVKIDFCFLDYEPPLICREMIQSFCDSTCAAVVQDAIENTNRFNWLALVASLSLIFLVAQKAALCSFCRRIVCLGKKRRNI